MRNKTNHTKRRPRITLIRLFSFFGLFLLLFFFFGSAVGGRMGFFHQMALETLGPVQVLFTRSSGALVALKDDYVALWDLRDENKRLLKEIDKLHEDLSEYREAYTRNLNFETELAFKKAADFPPLTARVVGKDPSFWFQTLVVDRGRADGVVSGMVARTSQGVAGQVIQVSRNYSKILLANAPSSAIDAIVQKNRVRGVLKGAGTKGYSLHYVLKNSDIEVGDMVVTAGAGGMFPSGVPLGAVSAVRSHSRGMFLEVDVKPAVDFERLEFLFVNLGEQQKIDEELLSDESRRE
ncbi:MAG: rod shape-determining protein MreC [Desulfobulbaceae bacterium]|uniref:Cell shape-determining protein MreC n=1 Tax=Candidatus Desulfatifera sulfidica TaxID=2841691 RepID=A0A8J6N6P5_9BACT|nr:rod shape-determining protein MreC [Candidatus Desulfatifera sulfidica]